MHALIRTETDCRWVKRDEPLPRPGEVLLSVRLVGLCLTDLYVAAGKLPVSAPLVLGHEFVGEVTSVNEGNPTIKAAKLVPGQRVAVDPVVRCHSCSTCNSAIPHACSQAKFLGLDIDGAMANRICLPIENAWPVDDRISDEAAAMLEPIAACAAVLRTPIAAAQAGLLIGNGRIVELTRRVLKLEGFSDLTTRNRRQLDSDQNSEFDFPTFDFVVDCVGTTESLESACQHVKPGGCVVIKSRPFQRLEFDVRRWLPKQIGLHLANYHDYQKAHELLHDGRLQIEDFVGPVWPSHEFKEAFMAAEHDRDRKHYLLTPFEEPVALESSKRDQDASPVAPGPHNVSY